MDKKYKIKLIINGRNYWYTLVRFFGKSIHTVTELEENAKIITSNNLNCFLSKDIVKNNTYQLVEYQDGVLETANEKRYKIKLYINAKEEWYVVNRFYGEEEYTSDAREHMATVIPESFLEYTLQKDIVKNNKFELIEIK